MQCMNKTHIKIIVLVIIFLGGWYFLSGDKGGEISVYDPMNTTYLIEEESFTLVNGSVEKESAPGSATKNARRVISF